jgi:hypothetical protein
MVFFVWMLGLLPDPTAEDIAMRTERLPMKGPERKAFFMKFAFGLTALIIFYVALTAFRDFRDNFMAELLTALGFGETPGIFTATEVPVTIGVLALLAFIMFIRNNMRALMVNHVIIAFGALVVGASTWLLPSGHHWGCAVDHPHGFRGLHQLHSLQLHPVRAAHCGLQVSQQCRISHLSGRCLRLSWQCAVLFYKDFFVSDLDWVTFFTYACYGVSASGVLFTTAALVYFQRKKQEMRV